MTGPAVLRPSARAYRRWLAGIAPGGIGLLALAWWQARDAPWVLVASAAFAIAVMAVAVVRAATDHVILEPRYVVMDGAARRRVTIPLDRVVGLSAPLQRRDLPGQPVTRVVVLRSVDGGPRIRLDGGLWDEADLTLVARHTGIEVLWLGLDRTGFERRVPGLLPLYERRPWLVIGAAVVVLALAAAPVLLLR
ncbi:MAG: hypothetical protein PGN07_11200 [Aeromicrobium erythreum]